MPPRPAPRRRRLRDAAAVLGLGAVIMGAALAPALASTGDARTAVSGTVVAGGRPLAGVEVGFWAPQRGTLRTTRTDASGAFSMDAPSFVDGYVYAGRSPVARRALFSVGARSYVRGIIGREVPPSVAFRLYQGHASSTPRTLAGGGPLRFSLQESGSLTGRAALLAARGGASGRVQVQRLDGSVVATPAVRAGGEFRTGQLVPGDYAVRFTPRAPYLPATVPARVSGARAAVVATPSFTVGAAVSGRVVSDGVPETAAVPVRLSRDGVLLRRTTTRNGTYSLADLEAGTYRLEVGRYEEERPPNGATPAPSAAASPATPGRATPDATSTPTVPPPPTPASSSSAAGDGTGARGTASGRPTSDDVLPASVEVTVGPELLDVDQDVTVEPAGRVTGRITGAAPGAAVDVLLEDPTSRTVLRTTRAGRNGSFTLGGLVTGTDYAVLAIDRPSDPATARYGSATLTAGVGAQRVDVALGQQALTLSGRVDGAASGAVTAGGIERLGGAGAIGADGSYSIAGLVPAAYEVTAATPGRLVSTAVTVLVESATAKDLDQGPAPGGYRAWFISGGAGVAQVVGTAVDAAGRTISFGPRTDEGYVTVRGVRPGTYRYVPASFVGTAPARDGPWWFGPPQGGFTLRAGGTTDLGPLALVLHAR